MARNGPLPKPPPETSADDVLEATTSNLEQFSQQLAARYPDRMIQQFVMPTNVRECREIFLMEITSRDEIRAAALADAMMSPQERASQKLANDAEKRECIRISIVGIGERAGGWRAPDGVAISYRHVDNNSIPFVEINDWSGKAWASLHTYFGQLNGVPIVEIEKGIMEARTVGAFAPPKSAIPASADTGR